MSYATKPSRREVLKQVGALAAASALPLGFPAIVRAQSETVRIGHITPRTGFLGQAGEQGFRAAMLAVEEANAAGGVLGRRIELIAEDSVNPATAVNKAQKLLERD
jgi:branched-chain amino acid transport system substrate-binding protein